MNRHSSQLSVAIVGGGFGGIGMGIRLRQTGIKDFSIFERADRVGGVWRANSYPGAACDVPSHLYSFSFAPGHNWTRRYAPRQDIVAYMNALVDDYGIREHIRFNTEATSARFNPETGKWSVSFSDGERRDYDLLVTACGQLTNPAIPDLPGVDGFRGKAFHSAHWNHDCDLRGKHIAVIGTGSSAIQFVPEIAPQAAQLTVYQRSPPWILPKPDRRYPKWERRFFRAFPLRVAISRLFIFGFFEIATYGFTGHTWVTRPFKWIADFYRRRSLKERPNLLAKSTPDYEFGCKRLLFTNDWYKTLKRDNVELIAEAVERITPTGVVARDGVERPADVIIWGTGFHAGDFVAPMKIEGLHGSDLNEAWAGTPAAYLGTTVSGFPNMFILYGPNTNHGSGSVPYTHECQFNYILDAIAKLEKNDCRYLDLAPATQQRWRREMDERGQKTVWVNGGCGSWYVNEKGQNTNNWPGAWLEYRRRTKTINPRDYRFVT